MEPKKEISCFIFNCVTLDNDKIKEEYIKLAILLAYHQRHKFVYADRDSQLIQSNLDKFSVTNHFA